jgi:hypothetical protein
MKTTLAMFSFVFVAAACSSGTSGPGSSQGQVTGGTGNAGTANGGTGSGSNSGSSGGGGGPSMSLTIPFNVSDTYIPSGYMGDGMMAGAIAQLPQTTSDSQTCDGDRSPPAKGICYTITYTPVPVSSGGLGWGGVYWQFPSNNWGMSPGVAIGSGATKVSVWAKGKDGGEAIQLTVGGINNMHNAGTYADAFEAKAMITLTSSWAEYSVTLPSDYNSEASGVIGALSWTAGAPSSGTAVTFSLDSIDWE